VRPEADKAAAVLRLDFEDGVQAVARDGERARRFLIYVNRYGHDRTSLLICI
jgi:hypothetical protein